MADGSLVATRESDENQHNLPMTVSAIDMNLDDLTSFVQVVHSGGFTAAARVRGRSTKHVSRQVARLEGHLGHALLARTTRAVGLTEMGRKFYVHAVRIIDEVHAAGETLTGDQALRGELRVCAPTIATVIGLAGALRSFHEAHPHVLVQIKLTDRPRELIAEGYDLQVISAQPTQSTMVVRRLLTLDMPLAAHERYLERWGAPRRPEDLGRHQCLRFVSDIPQATWSIVHERKQATASVRVSGPLTSDNSALLYLALEEGMGVGVCGKRFLDRAGASRGLVRVLDGWRFEPMPLYAVFPPVNRKSALIDAFLEHLTGVLRQWL